jgi:hypothetical protein
MKSGNETPSQSLLRRLIANINRAALKTTIPKTAPLHLSLNEALIVLGSSAQLTPIFAQNS